MDKNHLEMLDNPILHSEEAYDISKIDANDTRIDKFPLPSNYDSFELYYKNVELWKSNITKALNILPSILSEFYSRPCESTISNLNSTENAILGIKQTEIKHSTTADRRPWKDMYIWGFPDPNLFDTYDKFNAAANKWYSSSLKSLTLQIKNNNGIEEEDVVNKYILHPLELPFEVRSEHKPVTFFSKCEQNKSDAVVPKEFVNVNTDNLKRLHASYLNGFSLSMDIDDNPYINEYTQYGCDVFIKMKIKCDIEPRITLTPIEFIKMLELDYEKLSSNDKKKICDHCIYILSSSRFTSVSLAFSSSVSLCTLVHLFSEYVKYQIDIIDPEFEYLQNPFFLPYHENLFKVYFTKMLYKIFLVLGFKAAALTINKLSNQFFDGLVSLFKTMPFYYDFTSNLYEQPIKSEEVIRRMSDQMSCIFRDMSEYPNGNGYHSYQNKVKSLSKVIYSLRSSIDSDFLLSESSGSFELYNSSLSSYEVTNSEIIVALYLVAFQLKMEKCICKNSMILLSYILEQSPTTFNKFVFKIIANKRLVVHFFNQLFENEKDNYLTSFQIINFIKLLIQIDLRKMDKSFVLKNNWLNRIISLSIQKLHLLNSYSDFVEKFIYFACKYNKLRKTCFQDVVIIMGLLSAFISNEEPPEILSNLLNSFSYLLSDKNSIIFFNNTIIITRIFDNLRNKNRVVLKSAWKVLRSLFKYHQNQFLFQEYPVIKDYFVLAIKDKDPEVFNNVLEQIILFLTKIIKYYTNEEKFISHRCCNNFLSISRTIKESEFNLEDSCIFIESEELNKREEYERKQVIIDYLECVKEKPFIEKFLENPEFRVEAPSMIFKERMKEFSFKKRKK